MEVQDPTGRFRVDVAGWTDRAVGTRVRMKPRSVLVECKQSRNDYFRNSRQTAGLLARRAAILDRLSRSQPEASPLFTSGRRAPLSLFESGTLADDARALQRLRVEMASIERRLFRGIKLANMARWRGATQFWLAAPIDMISTSELPLGWGLIEASPQALESRTPEGIPASSILSCRQAAPDQEVDDRSLDRLVRNIAVANSRFVGGRTAPMAGRSSFLAG
ncbi:MAG: hypothetical protein CMJ40_01050 [Phycisphaerae bacterium]|nr:hypothetical protein [Phycisphaerae bacterium]